MAGVVIPKPVLKSYDETSLSLATLSWEGFNPGISQLKVQYKIPQVSAAATDTLV